MGFDLYQSRQTYNCKCRWWRRNTNDDIESDELIMKRVPNGIFMAKEVAPNRQQDIQVGGVFMFSRDNITIKSPDDLSEIEAKDLVEFNGDLWIVESVQRTKARVQNTFFGKDIHCSHYWYLELRK